MAVCKLTFSALAKFSSAHLLKCSLVADIANSMDQDHSGSLYPETLLQFSKSFKGVQWLSGRVLNSRPKGRGFEPHLCHCVVSLSKTLLSLLKTGSTQKDPSRLN